MTGPRGKRRVVKELSMNHWYKLWKRYTVHPSLEINYFKTIDSKEKAYWLGFIYADGSISGNGTMIRIELGQKDEGQIDRFCTTAGLDKNRKLYRIREGSERVAIQFRCKAMRDHLLKHGVKVRKSKTIEFPKLFDRDLELAFLLGYYDGDGKQNTTRIMSGSMGFLEQIKERFNLSFRINATQRESEICGRRIKGTEYYMHLGTELFNEMMENYTRSMPRKRRLFCDSDERQRRVVEAHSAKKVRERKELQREWRAITKEKLEKLVTEMPLRQIAAEYNITECAVAEKCDKYGISRPEKNYWQKRRALEEKLKQN
jgi:hypothetical protein